MSGERISSCSWKQTERESDLHYACWIGTALNDSTNVAVLVASNFEAVDVGLGRRQAPTLGGSARMGAGLGCGRRQNGPLFDRMNFCSRKDTEQQFFNCFCVCQLDFSHFFLFFSYLTVHFL